VGENLSIHGRGIVPLVALEGARELGNIAGVTNGRRQRVFFNFLPLFPRYMNYSPFWKGASRPKKIKYIVLINFHEC